MGSGQLHYLPLSGVSFSILASILAVVFLLVQFGLFRFAYMRLGMSSGAALLLLVGSLAGSYFNIPLTELPGHHELVAREVDYFGMQYVVPLVERWPGTMLAVNVGGALIPTLTSLYLLTVNGMWMRGLLATMAVAVVCYSLSAAVPGLGIAEPVFVPSLAAAIVALVLARGDAAPLAYVGGSLGTLLGADIFNLDKIAGLGAPVASIGGAGTFDGVFLIGVVAVALASLSGDRTEDPAAS